MNSSIESLIAHSYVEFVKQNNEHDLLPLFTQDPFYISNIPLETQTLCDLYYVHTKLNMFSLTTNKTFFTMKLSVYSHQPVFCRDYDRNMFILSLIAEIKPPHEVVSMAKSLETRLIWRLKEESYERSI